MNNSFINKELNNFFEEKLADENKLKLIIDEVPISEYVYDGVKLSDITPVYSKRKIHIIEVKKNKKKDNTLF